MVVIIEDIKENKPFEPYIRDLLLKMEFEPKKKVFVKPNVSRPVKGDSGIVVDYLLVKALIEVLNREVIIGESSAFGTDTRESLEKAGYYNLDVEIVDLEKVKRRVVKWKYGKLSLPEYLFDKNISYINFAKMKTHIGTKVVLSMKNQMGLLMEEDKVKFHKLGLLGPIQELAKLVKPDLVLMDAVVALEGNGPGKMGKPKRLNIVLASDSMLEMDNVCCKIMGIDNVEYIPKMNLKVIGELRNEKFLRPNNQYIKILNNKFYFPNSACPCCTGAVIASVKKALKNPLKWPGFLKKRVFVCGNIKVPNAIYIGDCTEKPDVKGCPPDVEDIVKKL